VVYDCVQFYCIHARRSRTRFISAGGSRPLLKVKTVLQQYSLIWIRRVDCAPFFRASSFRLEPSITITSSHTKISKQRTPLPLHRKVLLPNNYTIHPYILHSSEPLHYAPPQTICYRSVIEPPVTSCISRRHPRVQENELHKYSNSSILSSIVLLHPKYIIYLLNLQIPKAPGVYFEFIPIPK
jgi:hypothetical protein